MDYLEKRRHNLNKDEVKAAFATLVEFYTLEWLTSNKGHAIQTLWKRKDYIATNELYALGLSIQKLSSIDLNWTRNQVKQSKTADKNNSQGALFEILCLGFMDGEEHSVKPAFLNQAGYDGAIHFPDAKEIRMSIKNYGISNPQERFEKKAKETEETILKLLKKYDYPPVTIVIDATDHYPENDDWEFLHTHIDQIFKIKRHDPEPMFCLTYPLDEQKANTSENLCFAWTLLISPFTNASDYHKHYKTYTLIVTSQYHKHESKNLFSKIETACFNLAKHSITESEQLLNGLFLHLPINASVTNCHQWLTEYFDTYPDKPISFVVLYQPTVAMDIDRSITVIHHHAVIYWRNKRILKWNPKGLHLKFNLPVGRVSNKPSSYMLIIDYPDGRREELTMDNRYFYQHGSHYEKMKLQADGSYVGKISKLAGGVHTHVVLQMPGQAESVVMSEITPPFDELLIL